MGEKYLTKLVYKNTNIFLIWYSDNQDGFLMFQQKLLMFQNYNDANAFVKERGICLEDEMAVIDLSKIDDLMNNIDLSENCSNLINIWNFLGDLANSLGEDFIGNQDEGIIIDIYHKFNGINFKGRGGDTAKGHEDVLDDTLKNGTGSVDDGLKGGSDTGDTGYKIQA